MHTLTLPSTDLLSLLDKSVVVLLDDTGIIRHASSQWCQTMGYQREQLIGQAFSQLLTASAEGSTPLSQLPDLGGDKTQHHNVYLNTGYGLAVNYALTVTAVDIPETGYWWVQGHDNSRMEQLEKQNAAALAELQASNAKLLVELKEHDRINAELQWALAERAEAIQQLLHAQKMDVLGRMTAGIAHDFNNLLAIIIGNNELTLEDLVNHQFSELSNYQTNIQIAAHRGVELIKKLMQYCRQSHPRERNQYHNTFSQVERSQSMMRSVLPASLQLIYKLQPVPDTLLDGAEMMQIVSNLMVNARDAIDGSGTISVSLNTETASCETLCSDCNKPLTETHDHQSFVCLSISDTGCGISPDQLKRIFDPFFTTKAVDKGTGLGLSVISGIVHEVGGHILVDSPTGRGTRFRVMVPSPALLDTPNDNLALKPDKTLLVVDDEPLYLATLVNRLRRKGYVAQAFEDPSIALKAFSQSPESYTAAILDYNMPQMNGLQLAQQLLALRADLPIAISSGQEIDVATPLTVQLFPKPFQFDSFLVPLEQKP